MPRPTLSQTHLESWLSERPDWGLSDGKLHRVFTFNDFLTAFAWMGRVAEVAESMGHHPEWFNVYARVEVWLTTHDAGGLTSLDLTLAEAMERSLP
ncbi:MAG: 4a-hydroxytetrahydrobiopterin dehydratase [Myxococcota bacterium]